jgi:hypothetical protein
MVYPLMEEMSMLPLPGGGDPFHLVAVDCVFVVRGVLCCVVWFWLMVV